jgi:MoaA/NifB/PqqE/SkfB family radical SAM enzyme
MINYAEKIKKFRSLKDEMLKNVTCWAPFQAIHVDKFGNFRSCPFSPPIGKWSLDNKILDIWNSTAFEDIRDVHAIGGMPLNCSYCLKSIDEGKPPSSLDFDNIGGEKSFNHSVPKEIELELSNTCNYMCNACGPYHSTQHVERLGLQNDFRYQSAFDNPEYIDAFVEDLRSIIHDVHRINFTGGEPFAQMPVYKILKMISEEDAQLIMHFTTNGSVMNGSVRKLAKRPNTHFTVSLDSIDPDVYPIVRVNGKLDNVMNNIEILRKTSTNMGCSFVITKYNVRDLPNIVSWCNNKDITFSYHILMNMNGGPIGYLTPICVEEETKEYLQEMREYLLSAKIDIHDTEINRNNVRMLHQYAERLK